MNLKPKRDAWVILAIRAIEAFYDTIVEILEALNPLSHGNSKADV
jgi:hypothetical protein